jgi:hypothetical protein
MSASLNHDDPPHSAGSSTRVSVTPSFAIDDPAARSLKPTSPVQPRPLSIKDDDAQHTATSSSENRVPVVRPQTPAVTESEREQIERERAVEAVSPPGEYRANPEDEKEARQEKGDPFLVVWDGENDKENPRVCPRRTRMSFLIHQLLRLGRVHIAGTCTSPV